MKKLVKDKLNAESKINILTNKHTPKKRSKKSNKNLKKVKK